MAGTTVHQIAVLAYGSLLSHPGEWLGKNMQTLIRCETPFGVEYLGCAKDGRGSAPTLVKSETHRKVLGGLIVLPHTDSEEGLSEVRQRVAERERAHGKSAIKDDLEMFGYRVVYSDFKARFDNPTPIILANAAIQSVQKCYDAGHAFMNGIRYLAENLEWGVQTDLSNAYKEAILASTKAGTLEAAEQIILRAIKAPERSLDPKS